MIEGPIDRIIDLPKQLRFATAKTLTQVAREAQVRVIDKIKGELHTGANEWYLPQNRFGVHLKPATPENLSASLESDAYWLAALEQGEAHVPIDGRYIAIPTPELKRMLADPGRPRRPGLFANAFFITTKSGLKLLAKRFPGQAKPVVLFVLKERVPRPTKKVMTEIVEQTIREEFGPLLSANIQDAIATAK